MQHCSGSGSGEEVHTFYPHEASPGERSSCINRRGFPATPQPNTTYPETFSSYYAFTGRLDCVQAATYTSLLKLASLGFQYLSANGLNAFISCALCVKGKVPSQQISGASGKYSKRLFKPQRVPNNLGLFHFTLKQMGCLRRTTEQSNAHLALKAVLQRVRDTRGGMQAMLQLRNSLCINICTCMTP